ncbi:MAG: hypothetical protein JWN60_2129 [Acidobacteria bacterium]|jgi:hypothetical protein|nr:hypothetical protein [Acidobacteriota bacterium]
MFLDAVKKTTESNTNELFENGFGSHTAEEVYTKWAQWQPSLISHHGDMCCEISREWVTAMDFSELNGEDVLTGPRWLREKFHWGCSTFPIFWCEAVRKSILDCGALAALAHEVFISRGVKSVRVQLVQKFSKNSTRQWASNWHDGNTQLEWVNEDLIYHEGCAVVLPDNKIKIWDASAGWWVDPKQRNGYGSVVAVRLFASSNNGAETGFTWGDHHLTVNFWQKIAQVSESFAV